MILTSYPINIPAPFHDISCAFTLYPQGSILLSWCSLTCSDGMRNAYNRPPSPRALWIIAQNSIPTLNAFIPPGEEACWYTSWHVSEPFYCRFQHILLMLQHCACMGSCKLLKWGINFFPRNQILRSTFMKHNGNSATYDWWCGKLRDKMCFVKINCFFKSI